jgi:hypothetical protein
MRAVTEFGLARVMLSLFVCSVCGGFNPVRNTPCVAFLRISG